jgi:hypothetical protein
MKRASAPGGWMARIYLRIEGRGGDSAERRSVVSFCRTLPGRSHENNFEKEISHCHSD